MSDISMLSARLDSSQDLLSAFTKSIQYIQTRKNLDEQERKYIKNILSSILFALEESLNNKISQNHNIEGRSILLNLQSLNTTKYKKDWNVYIQNIISISKKISNDDLVLKTDEISILNDIAEALDNECDQIFNKMHG